MYCLETAGMLFSLKHKELNRKTQ